MSIGQGDMGVKGKKSKGKKSKCPVNKGWLNYSKKPIYVE